MKTLSRNTQHASRPLTAPLRAARAFDTALALVLDQQRMDSQCRSLIICGPADDDRLLLLAPRLNEIAQDVSQNFWADDDQTRKQTRNNLRFNLANLAAFCLLWLTTGQSDLTRGCKAIQTERQRQKDLSAAGKIGFRCEDPFVDNRKKFRVLFEECGEVAHAIYQIEHHGLAVGNLRHELIQVAAVCVAWLESLEGRAALPRRQSADLQVCPTTNGGAR